MIRTIATIVLALCLGVAGVTTIVFHGTDTALMKIVLAVVWPLSIIAFW